MRTSQRASVRRSLLTIRTFARSFRDKSWTSHRVLTTLVRAPPASSGRTGRAHFEESALRSKKSFMKRPISMRSLEDLGRARLSKSFFFRDFLYSEIAAFYGVKNIPDDPGLAIQAGTALCQNLLEPLQCTFGRIAVRSGFRSREVTEFGNSRGFGASVANNAAYHVWDIPDRCGRLGAAACIVIPWFADRYQEGADWRCLAWWIHDHFSYNHLQFFPKLCAFNIQWTTDPRAKRIDSYIDPVGCLTKPGMPNGSGDHSEWYRNLMPQLRGPSNM